MNKFHSGRKTGAIAKYENNDEVIGIGINDSKNLRINKGIGGGEPNGNKRLLLC